MKAGAVAALIAAAALLSGCLGRAAGEPAPADLAAAQQRWEARGPADYAYTFRQACFCPPEHRIAIRVHVTDGRVTDVHPMHADERIPEDLRELARPIAEWLAFVADARQAGYADVRVAFDKRYGYPTEIRIDRDARMADDERHYMLSDLEAR